jgi:hypothetical protein
LSFRDRRMPTDHSRSNEGAVEALLAYCRQNDRVCPKPKQWNVLYEMLPDKRRLTGWEPPLPLVSEAWYETPDEAKMERLEEHIRWGERHGCLDAIAIYMRNLREGEWHHVGDESRWWLVERECPSVLVVNDGSVQAIERVLTTNGYDVHLTSKILDALEWTRQMHPHVAIIGNFISMRERVQLANELSRYCEVLVSEIDGSDDWWDLIWEPQGYGTIEIPVDERELLDKARMCVYNSEKTRLDTAGAVSRSADSIEEFAAAVASILNVEIAHSQQTGCPCSALLVKVVEEWRESQGDVLLRGMRVLPQVVSEQMELWCLPHPIFRDERFGNFFTVVLSEADNSKVDEFAKDLHSLIRRTDWRRLIGGSVSLTASISAATFPQDGTSAGELLERIWFGTGRLIPDVQ